MNVVKRIKQLKQKLGLLYLKNYLGMIMNEFENKEYSIESLLAANGHSVSSQYAKIHFRKMGKNY